MVGGFSTVLVGVVRDLLGVILVVEPRGSVDVLRGSRSPVAGFKQLFNSREPVFCRPDMAVPLVLGFIKPLGLSPVELWQDLGLSVRSVLFLRGKVPYGECFVLAGSAELGLIFSNVDTFSVDLEDTGPFFSVPFFLAPIDLGGARPDEVTAVFGAAGLASLLAGAASLDVGFLRVNPLGFITGLGAGISSSSSSSVSSTGSLSGDSSLVC